MSRRTEDTCPTVSVILPTYDRTGYLREAVASVTAQTYENIELVIVDDHSPTPAEDVLSDVSFSSLVQVQCIRHETNKGANAARNSGIAAANGEFLAFLDDDDRWEETKIEQQIEVFKTGPPEVGVVYTGVRYKVNGNSLVDISTTGGNVTKAILIGESIAIFSAVMVRASVIEQAGVPDERFPSWQDREWYLRLSQHCTFIPIQEPLTIRRAGHEGQISRNFEAKRDVSYPLFIEKHRTLAAEYGPLCEQQMYSSLLGMLATSAIKVGRYTDARALLFKALIHFPFNRQHWLYLGATLGGEHTYQLAQKLTGRSEAS